MSTGEEFNFGCSLGIFLFNVTLCMAEYRMIVYRWSGGLSKGSGGLRVGWVGVVEVQG